jgi:pilus assembly protein Flp/PilA
MRNFIRRFIKNEAGATAIEYGLIASLIAVAIITATQTLGTGIGDTFNSISDSLSP